MVEVKICGIRQNREVDILNSAYPDYAGFVFAPSKRRVSKNEATELISRLNSKIKPIGVFVNENISVVQETVTACGLYGVQLHGNENETYLNNLRGSLPPDIEIWKAVKVSSTLKSHSDKDLYFNELSRLSIFITRFLFDGTEPGSGKPFNHELLPAVIKKSFLAGGLTIDTIKTVIVKNHPFGVDVSSGVEAADGFKDEYMIRTFINRAKGES